MTQSNQEYVISELYDSKYRKFRPVGVNHKAI